MGKDTGGRLPPASTFSLATPMLVFDYDTTMNKLAIYRRSNEGPKGATQP